MRKVRASSTMPLLMPITEIDGDDFVDGALSLPESIALDAARSRTGSTSSWWSSPGHAGIESPVRLPAALGAVPPVPEVARALLARPANYNRTLDELLELERQSGAYLLFPETMPIENSERDIAKLGAVFDSGLTQARRETPAIREFLGLAV